MMSILLRRKMGPIQGSQIVLLSSKRGCTARMSFALHLASSRVQAFEEDGLHEIA